MVLAFFGRIARAAAKQGLADIAAACVDPTGISAVNYFGKVAGEVWRDIRHDNKHDKLHDEILEAAKLTFEEAKLAGLEAAQEATTDPELQGHIERFVTLIPASIQASLRRPEDPTGTTLPKGFEIHDEQDIVKLLPVRLPRFKAGDMPLWLRGWRLVEQIGAGGFGEVWKVQNSRASNLLGAVKFSHGMTETEFSLLNEGDVLNRLLAEGDHEGIVPLQDMWADGDPVPWIRFKYIAGGDLTTQIHRWQTLPVNERLDKVISAVSHLAKTVGYFHRLEPKIVHRDLKPSNILVEAKSGKLLIADFGIGAVSSTRAIKNERNLSQSQGAVIATYLRGSHTPLYASPQQKMGSRDIDPRDDVHALGVVAYQMLTGQLDAAPGTDIEEELTDRQTPDWLIALIKSSVAYKLERRPNDGDEVSRILTEGLSNTSSKPIQEPAHADVPIAKTTAIPRKVEQLEVESSGTDTQGVGELRLKFWTGFKEFLKLRGSKLKGSAPSENYHMNFPVRAGVVFNSTLQTTDNRRGSLVPQITAGIYFDGADSHDLYDSLIIDRTQYDEAIGSPMYWHKSKGKARAIYAWKETDYRVEQDWQVQYEWLQKTLERVRDVFLPTVMNFSKAESTKPVVTPALKAGDRKEIELPGGVKLTMAWCPPGTFQMGGTGGNDEKPVHTVTLTEGFWIGIFPVTQAQFQAIMGHNPSYFMGADCPVENVSWDNAQQFVRNIYQMTGREFCLPTEAQWEYACRAGSTSDYCNGNGEASLRDVGWFSTNSGDQTHPVGKLAGNAWGIHDCHGNVWEWCEDRYSDTAYQRGDCTDPTGPKKSGLSRVFRGGCWISSADKCRAGCRKSHLAESSDSSLGFRIALV